MEMCEAIVKICHSLAVKEVPRAIATPMRGVRFIAISRTDGGIRPSGIGEIIRRAIVKTLANIIKDDVKVVTGSIQCSGRPCACEVAINATEAAKQNGTVDKEEISIEQIKMINDLSK